MSNRYNATIQGSKLFPTPGERRGGEKQRRLRFRLACLAVAIISFSGYARFHAQFGEGGDHSENYSVVPTVRERNDVSLGSSIHAATETSAIRDALCLETGESNEKNRLRPEPGEDACLLHIDPDPYFVLLLDVLVGLRNAGACDFQTGCKPPHKPYRENHRRFGDDWPPYGFTMIGKERLTNFRAAILEVNRNHVPGAIAEFGVWRGGAMIMAAAVQKFDPSSANAPRRDLFLFDAFGSFGEYGNAEDFLAVSMDQVKENFQILLFDVDKDENIHFVQGLFSDTAAQWTHKEDPIAVLRLDGNFYSSYQDVLYAAYENVPVGGIIIFDDVFHPHYKEVMQCWLHFKADHDIPEELVRIDRGSGWFRKKKKVTIDQSKKREAKSFEQKK